MKYLHVNIISKDWESLSLFYQEVFGCVPLEPRREYTGPWIENLVNIKGVRVFGEHIALPGYGEGGPTLEIFTYNVPGKGGPLAVNDYGFAHICFEIEQVPGTLTAVLERLVDAGGSIVSTFAKDQWESMKCVYARDPEGNIIEIHY